MICEISLIYHHTDHFLLWRYRPQGEINEFIKYSLIGYHFRTIMSNTSYTNSAIQSSIFHYSCETSQSWESFSFFFFSPINRNDTRSNEKGIVFPFTRGKIIMSMYIYTNAKHRKCSYIDSIQSTIQLKNDSYFHFKETTNNVCLRIDIHSAYNCCPSKIHYAHLEATFTIETWLSPYHITLNCTNLIRWTSPSSECRARSAF